MGGCTRATDTFLMLVPLDRKWRSFDQQNAIAKNISCAKKSPYLKVRLWPIGSGIAMRYLV